MIGLNFKFLRSFVWRNVILDPCTGLAGIQMTGEEPSGLQQDQIGVFEAHDHRIKKACRFSAIHYPVIEGEG